MEGLGSSSGSEASSGWNITGDGLSVVGLAWISAGNTHATEFVVGGMNVDLGSTVPDRSSRANAANFDGSVVGGWQDGAGRQGAVWVDGVQELIFDNDGNAAGEVMGVSDDGKYACGLDIGSFVVSGNPYRYDIENDVYLELGVPGGGERNTSASAVTADGKVIGGGFWPFGVPATFGNGFIWEEGMSNMLAADYFAAKGVAGIPKDYNFNFVSDVSPNGEWFIGWGGTGFAASQSWAVRIPQVLLGDVNCDGEINLLDVQPFVALLSTGGFSDKADINGDGEVNLLDVGPFVDLLSGE